uniref:AP complex mu/sigma subunit domain-containing protein n=1 Tax=Marmota marmota marmota TaxID=9994 RepID=A0A8C5ZAX0_MARMA
MCIHIFLYFSSTLKTKIFNLTIYTELGKWYIPLSDKEKKKITRELVQTILAQKPKMWSFLEWLDLKIVHKKYASLYICCKRMFQGWGCGSSGNMLAWHAQGTGFNPQHHIKIKDVVSTEN